MRKQSGRPGLGSEAASDEEIAIGFDQCIMLSICLFAIRGRLLFIDHRED